MVVLTIEGEDGGAKRCEVRSEAQSLLMCPKEQQHRRLSSLLWHSRTNDFKGSFERFRRSLRLRPIWALRFPVERGKEISRDTWTYLGPTAKVKVDTDQVCVCRFCVPMHSLPNISRDFPLSRRLQMERQ
jgi:hypothetical protein